MLDQRALRRMKAVSMQEPPTKKVSCRDSELLGPGPRQRNADCQSWWQAAGLHLQELPVNHRDSHEARESLSHWFEP